MSVDFFLFYFIYTHIHTHTHKGRGGKKERERNMDERNVDQLSFVHTPTGVLACNPGMCPDWDSNQ